MNNENGKIGLFTCITIIIGSMIGSAIFSLSGLTMYKAGPGAIISWVLAAAIMLVYGLICAELSTRFPKSGGVFVFPSKALGKTERSSALWGWISTWGYINANIVAIAFAAIYVATYLGAGFNLPSGLQVPLAVISILICLFLNCIKFSVAGKLNSCLVGGLVVALAVYVITCFCGGSWDAELLTPFFTQGSNGTFGFMGAVPTAMVGYGSIVAIAFMVSEVKNPSKNVPKAVLIAMFIVAAIYALIILATLGLVSASFLEQNPGMRYIPLYAACFTKLTAYPWLAKVVSIAAILALLTTMLVVLALTSRAVQAAAEGGLLPKVFAKSNKFGVPAFASTVLAILAAIVSCFPAFTEQIVGFGTLFAAVTIAINIVSLYAARRTARRAAKEQAPDAIGVIGIFKAPGGNILPAVALILIIACYIPDIIAGGWIIWTYTIAWYAIGLLIFKLCYKSKSLA